MCIRELPDPRRREQQVLLMTNRTLRGLVRRCLQTDPEARPTMQEIIDELSRAVKRVSVKYFLKTFAVDRIELLKCLLRGVV